MVWTTALQRMKRTAIGVVTAMNRLTGALRKYPKTDAFKGLIVPVVSLPAEAEKGLRWYGATS